MLWPNQPEYLQIFSNDGPVTVKVRFSDKCCSVADCTMQWTELAQLVDPVTGAPFRHMYFDTFRHFITRYEIYPAKNQLTIFAGTREP